MKPLLLLLPVLAHAIYGGRAPSEPDRAWRWAASVAIDFGNELYDGRRVRGDCSAAVIGPRAVLTAAHCIALRPRSRHRPLRVKFYDESGRRVVAEREVTGVSMAPDYDLKTFDADVAVVAFAGDLPEDHVPVALARSRDLAAPRARVLVAGVGRTESHDAEGLRVADFVVMPAPAGRFVVRGAQRLVGLCHGDSGAPVIAMDAGEPKLVGVVSASRNPDCLREVSDAMVTMVPRFLDQWIDDAAGFLTGPAAEPGVIYPKEKW